MSTRGRRLCIHPKQAVELPVTPSPSFQWNEGSDGLSRLVQPALNIITLKAPATPVKGTVQRGTINLVRPLLISRRLLRADCAFMINHYSLSLNLNLNLDKGDNSGF